MAKKQKSFADKASGKGADADSVMVKYVKSIKSEKTGFWRFNEQMIKLRGGENLDAALKRIDESSNLVDIDLSEFESKAEEIEEKVFENEGISVQPYPVDFKVSKKNFFSSLRNPLMWIPSSSSLHSSTSAIREIIGRIIYRTWK